MLNLLSKLDWLALAIGLALGLVVIFAILARQTWAHRQSYGYSVYAADARRRGLSRMAGTFLVVALIASGAYLIRFALTQGSGPGLAAAPMPAADPLAEMRLAIPKLGVKAAVIEAGFAGQGWDISQLTDQAAHLAGTAIPGEAGNAALAAHITIPGAGWGPFQELEALQPGDSVFIETPSKTYSYLITEQRIAEANDMSVVLPTDDTRLTLVTCAGWDVAVERYTQRVVVVARLTN